MSPEEGIYQALLYLIGQSDNFDEEYFTLMWDRASLLEWQMFIGMFRDAPHTNLHHQWRTFKSGLKEFAMSLDNRLLREFANTLAWTTNTKRTFLHDLPARNQT